ncbi:hypothetical protein QQ045_027217 [Rhodiola kirilowii]
MGSCVSTSTQSSDGDSVCSSHQGSKFHEQGQPKKTNSEIDLQNLASVPNRIFSNGKNRSSCMFTQQGQKGINQDAMIVWEDFISDDVTLFGVFDGHGPYGHLVARRVRDVLPVKLQSYYRSLRSTKKLSKLSCLRASSKKSKAADSMSSCSIKDKLDVLWKEVFLKSYKVMDKELKSGGNLDCFCSGSTAVTIVKQGTTLFIANIGDSRAILGTKDGNGSVIAVQLTVDLKPDLPNEAERIKQCNGRVFAMRDEPEVSRVWLPYDDAPGLAMARAFGDFCLKNYGVISVPEFARWDLTELDQFVVLASDGVWDVLRNEEVVEIVSTAPTRSLAARSVVDAAAREWKLKYPTSRIDDCAVVCLYLDGKMDPEFEYSTLHSNPSLVAVVSDEAQISEPTLQRNYTVKSSSADDKVCKGPLENKETEVAEDQTWSGLEGVTRVNSLVQLPRFSEERSDS